MNRWRLVCRAGAALCLSLVIATVFVQAQAQKPSFKPEVGQPGKDVVWVPTPQVLVDKMLDMANVTPRTLSWISDPATVAR